jgi:uncharacterized membrane protein (UPF0127 family)
MRIAGWFALPLLAATGLSACQQSPAAVSSRSESRAETIPLVVDGARGQHRFTVEVARTPEQQERGLMFRTALPPMGGMIFPFDEARPARFWMRNTPLPLDIIFIRQGGTIARIAARATPQSLDLIESGEPVVAVLEIAGGEAARLGIAEGDRVRW